MSDCFLFFRFWPGFAEPFPFERFNTLPDAELVSALDSFARKQLRIPEVRTRIKEVAKGRRRRFIESLNELWKRRSQGGPSVMRWTGPDFARKCWRSVRGAERKDPLVCRLGAYLGWWEKVWLDSSPFGPSVWFCRVSSPELAETLVSLLNGRTGVDYDGNEMEYYFRPRFGFVEDADTALRIVAQRCINAMRRGEAPDVRGSKAALAMGQKAMDIADEMLATCLTEQTPAVPVSEPQPPAAESQDFGKTTTPGQPTGNGDSTTQAEPLDAAGGRDGNTDETEPGLTASNEVGGSSEGAEDSTEGESGGNDGESELADYAELTTWAAKNLKGKQRQVVEELAGNKGKLSLADLALKVDWGTPYTDSFNSIKKVLNEKLKKEGWQLHRHDSEARLARIGQK